MTQDTALSILQTGANVFLTGEPGSGKTHTVNRYVAWLRERGIEPAITASTGIAATHIGGSTIHAWSGIGVLKDLTPADIDALTQKEHVVRRVGRTPVLIIDEISMLDGRTLDDVDAVLRAMRHPSLPFGGVQVVFVGDFFQLPPVSTSADRRMEDTLFYDEAPRTAFAFTSRAWKQANPIVCYLSEQHRTDDPVFLDILSSLRRGVLTEDHKDLLRERQCEPKEDAVTRLYSHNASVDRINLTELSKLPGKEQRFTMQEKGSEKLTAGLKKHCLSPEVLTLKEGARVMFTKNSFEQGFVNGTLGVVTRFSRTGDPVVETRAGKEITVSRMDWHVMTDGKPVATISQLPLRLAWAITVHKSQGMSLDAACMDLSTAFEYGQGYVALSRVRTLQGLFLLGANERALEVHPEVSSEDETFRALSDVAEETFEKMGEGEMHELSDRFVKASGGTLPKKKPTAK